MCDEREEGELTSIPTMQRVLDAFDEPAYLCTVDGVGLFANAAARACGEADPEWLPSCIRGEPEAAHLAKVTPVGAPNGAGPGLVVVIPRDSGASRRGAVCWNVPPRLTQVADLIAQGLTDREIAEVLGLSYHTARTYVTRLYRRLGVASRVEIAQMACRLSS